MKKLKHGGRRISVTNMKIVINDCYGGFGLSLRAQKRYAELKGFKIYFYDLIYGKNGVTSYKQLTLEEAIKKTFVLVLKVDLGNEILYKLPQGNDVWFHDQDIERDDPILIQVIEEMGLEANDICAELKIVEVPDDVKWEIDEYDGVESVEEEHRSWR